MSGLKEEKKNDSFEHMLVYLNNLEGVPGEEAILDMDDRKRIY